MEWLNKRWFNISSPMWLPPVKYRLPNCWWCPTSIRLWNLFNRHAITGEHWWGFGIFQLGRKHLFWIGNQGSGFKIKIFFFGETE